MERSIIIRYANRYYKQNAWISILRVFMCLVVIQDHFGTNNETLVQKFLNFLGFISGSLFYVSILFF